MYIAIRLCSTELQRLELPKTYIVAMKGRGYGMKTAVTHKME